MNGKIKQQILKLIQAKKACEESTKRMKKMTVNAKEYIDNTIRIFNANNDTSDILKEFKETETICDKYAILKKFNNNSYIIFYIHEDDFSLRESWERDWDFKNEIALYSNTKLYKDTNKKTQLIQIDNIYALDISICIGFDVNEVLHISRDYDRNFKSFSSNINDEKMILDILSIATKMFEMYSDSQNEFTEILVKLKENHYREILNAVFE